LRRSRPGIGDFDRKSGRLKHFFEETFGSTEPKTGKFEKNLQKRLKVLG
jgi:truncated hemoglobin YjbI